MYIQFVTLDPTLGVPFYRQVERQLAEQIRRGELAAGAALPSVRALAQELLVSVITVKQAYEALEAAGLVYSQQGRGTFVAPGGRAAAGEQIRAAFTTSVREALAEGRAAGLSLTELRIRVHDCLEEP